MDAMQMISMRQLTASERDQAFETAKGNLAGPEPELSLFLAKRVSKFPLWLEGMAFALAVIVFISAFIPSSFRIFRAAYDSFLALSFRENEAIIAGLALVLLSETSQLLFQLIISIVPVTKLSQRVFWSLAGFSTLLALVGNWTITEPQTPFAVLETIIPPLVVMGLGYGLKEISLARIGERGESLTLYNLAINQRQQKILDPFNTQWRDEWNRVLSRTLKDKLIEVNTRNMAGAKRQEILDALKANDWISLIQRELSEFVLVVTLEDKPRPSSEQPSQLQKTIADQLHPVQEDRVWQNESGLWSAHSGLTGEMLRTDYSSQGRAWSGVRQHNGHSQKGTAKITTVASTNGKHPQPN